MACKIIKVTDTPVQEQPDLTAIRQFIQAYPEIELLATLVRETPEAAGNQDCVISRMLYGRSFAEFDKTVVSLMAIQWVLNDEYDKFTACQNNPAIRLRPESFQKLKAYTETILANSPGAVQAMNAYMFIFDFVKRYTNESLKKNPENVNALFSTLNLHDLGKADKIISFVRDTLGKNIIDHDQIMLEALKADPDMFPSYQRLSPAHQQHLIEGMQSGFNLPQFVQAENVPASLTPLKKIEHQSLDFLSLEALFDIIGASGFKEYRGSATMVEPVFQSFFAAVQCLGDITKDASEKEIYDNYLRVRAEPLGLDIGVPAQRAVARVCCSARISKSDEAHKVLDVFLHLPPNTRAILEKEMNLSGIDDGQAIMLYYMPSLLNNLLGAHKKEPTRYTFEQVINTGLTTMARLYMEARTTIKDSSASGVYTVNIHEVASAATSPDRLWMSDIELTDSGVEAVARIKEHIVISTSRIAKLSSLADLPGSRYLLSGIGGGTDAPNVAVLGKMMERSGKEIAGITSTRTENPGTRIIVENHGGLIYEDVYRILPSTIITGTSSGRCLEPLPSLLYPTFLVIDKLDNKLPGKFQAIINYLEHIDVHFASDTGGDVLHPGTLDNDSKSTPDQDLRVLSAVNALTSTKTILSIIACGIDAPVKAEDILFNKHASYYEPDETEASMGLDIFKNWHLDGSSEKLFGKTAFVWQQALKKQFGLQVINIPSKKVVDSHNPWNPFVHVAESMRGIFFIMQ